MSESARTYLNLMGRDRKWGWIVIGNGGFRRSIVRVLAEGGLVWGGGDADGMIEGALEVADAAVKQWERGELELR